MVVESLQNASGMLLLKLVLMLVCERVWACALRVCVDTVVRSVIVSVHVLFMCARVSE